jgi:hypothetical protein
MITSMRLELLKINQERLAKKEKAESELFEIDMERMERRLEVKALKEEVIAEIEDFKKDLDA